MTKKAALPGVLSFQRGTVLSDGIFYDRKVDASGAEIPGEKVRVIRHGIRGVQEKGSVSNIQRTESAKTGIHATGLMVKFSLRTIPASHLLFACDSLEYRRSVEDFVDRFFTFGVPEFEEVCRRYARNILNGRWLWRNRVLGESRVEVKFGDTVYHSAGSRLRDFEEYSADEQALARGVIAAGFLSGSAKTPVMRVTGIVDFGFTGEVEVFPSQNMVNNKPKGFARSLYKAEMISRKDLTAILSAANNDDPDGFFGDQIIMGYAALRDQKIGNAIRTIDTWYGKTAPIPVEPSGASLETNEFHRKGGKEGKTLLSKIDEMIPGDVFNEDAAFLIALMIRGGVFSESKKGE